MNISSIVYSPLKDEENKLTGWSKLTVDYVSNNKLKVYKSIRGIAKSLNKVLSRSDVEDVYMEILCYLYEHEDYNLSKAYEMSKEDGQIISLEGYVHSCVKYCVIRYIHNLRKHDSNIQRAEVINKKDGKVLSMFEAIPDKKQAENYAKLEYDLNKMCELYESDRYLLGPDVFQIWFVRLQTIVYNKQDRYLEILSVLGVSKRDLSKIDKESVEDNLMCSIAKAITIVGVEEAIEILRKRVYCADRIEEVIKIF